MDSSSNPSHDPGMVQQNHPTLQSHPPQSHQSLQTHPQNLSQGHPPHRSEHGSPSQQHESPHDQVHPSHVALAHAVHSQQSLVSQQQAHMVQQAHAHAQAHQHAQLGQPQQSGGVPTHTLLVNPSPEEERLMKRRRRLIQNRKSAALSRARKKEYLSNLEKQAGELKIELEKANQRALQMQNAEWEYKNRIDDLEQLIKMLRDENAILKQKLGIPLDETPK